MIRILVDSLLDFNFIINNSYYISTFYFFFLSIIFNIIDSSNNYLFLDSISFSKSGKPFFFNKTSSLIFETKQHEDSDFSNNNKKEKNLVVSSSNSLGSAYTNELVTQNNQNFKKFLSFHSKSLKLPVEEIKDSLQNMNKEIHKGKTVQEALDVLPKTIKPFYKFFLSTLEA